MFQAPPMAQLYVVVTRLSSRESSNFYCRSTVGIGAALES